MAGSRRVTIEFLGDDKSASRTARSVDSTTSKLGATFAKVGKAAALGLGAGLVIAGAAAYNMAKAAIEDEAAAAKLAETLRNSAGATDEQIAATEDWISAQGLALGVTDDELRPALQRLVEATGDVGEAQRLASLAMDVSAATGKSLKSVSEALMKAQNGQVSGLSRLGIETKNAKGETLTFEQATAKMAETFKGAAAANADTLSGKMGRLKVMFDETKEAIGAKLLPVLTSLADWFFADGLPAIKRMSADLKEKLGPTFTQIQETTARLVAYIRKNWPQISKTIREVMKDVAAIVRGAVKLVTAIWDKWGDDIQRFTKTYFKGIADQIRNAMKVVRGIIDVVTGLIKGDWSQVWSGIKQIFGGVLGGIKDMLRNAMQGLREIIRSGWDAVKDITRAAFSGLRDLARNGLDAVVDLVRSIPGRIRGLAGGFASAGRGLISSFIDGMRSAGDFVGGIAGSIWDAVKGLINDAIDSINSSLEFEISVPGPNPSVNPPDIPRLARGGLVRARPGGTLALLGEAGEDELVTPMSKVRSLSSAGGQLVAELHVYLDGKEIQNSLVKLKRRNGGLALRIG